MQPSINDLARKETAPGLTDPGAVCGFGLFAEVDGFDAQELRGLAEFFFDAEELVVLGDAVGAAGRAGLDLAGAGAYREVGDEDVFGLAGAVGDDTGVAVAAGEFDGFEGSRRRCRSD